ncbi:sulfate transporter N-terminal domain with GLY motif-domain-containing protein [Chytriomyces sp. MP71]|nr:sulfate transporter N-terminal domain with GLY motif-domain-containing protein [Chytriomyces sp. MP71]
MASVALVSMPETRRVASVVETMFPAFGWIPVYSGTQDLPHDVAAGLALSTLVIPQAMAYAVLTSLPPVYGLYSAIFPPLTYFIFGSSPFQNIGPFAVTSVMVSQISTAVMVWLDALMPQYSHLESNDTNSMTLMANDLPMALQVPYSSIVMLLTFIVGILQFSAFLSGLGSRLSTVLPDSLVSAFMAASGICVLVSQLKSILGISIPQFNGFFSLILTLHAIIMRIPTAGICEIVLSIGTFLSLFILQQAEIYIMKLFIFLLRIILRRSPPTDTVSLCSSSPQDPPEPKASNKTIADVILTVLLTGLITSTFHLRETYGVKTIGPIPSGFPSPQTPWTILTDLPTDTSFHLFLRLLPGAFSLGLVCFVTTFSISKTFAPKMATSSTTDTTATNRQQCAQDLFALSMSTLVGSFLSSYAPSGSVSRSAFLATQTRVVSPLGSLVAVACVACVVLWFGALFEHVPICALSVVVVVALAGVLKKCGEGVGIFKDARDAHLKLAQTMKVVRGEREGGEAEGIVRNGVNGVIADTEERFVISDEELGALDENSGTVDIVEEEALSTNEIASVQTITTTETETQVRRTSMEVYLLKLRMISVYRDTVVWWGTFLSVLILDVGTGILFGILLSCLFMTVGWGYDALSAS